MGRKKLKSYHITTIQEGSFNFFTTATTHKKALERLIKNSFDFDRIVNDDKDFTINVKLLK